MVEQATQTNFIGTLGLNWKLLLAQAVNFGIVVFVLWKWVFKPVAGALEARREKIEKSLAVADKLERRIGEFESEREEKLVAASKAAQAIADQARLAAEKTKAETVAAARVEAERVMTAASQTMAAEKDQMMRELREEVATLTVMVAEKVLREKMDEKKDREMVKEIISSIK